VNERRVRLGISPCPNDTFAFHGLLTGAVRPRGFEIALELHDIQALNDGFAAGRYDAAKVSFAAALAWGDTSVVLHAGSALGFGVGPLLLARRGAPALNVGSGDIRVLCPGEHTTAHLLYRLFHGDVGRVEHVVFSEILGTLERGEADYGVCIHEGRFTYASHGLTLVEDLGATWESRMHVPLPLGGIVAQKSLGGSVIVELEAAIRASLDLARAEPDAALATMRRHARELDEAVIRAHVDLYVNEWTRDLGPVGTNALRVLSHAAREAGFVARHLPELTVAGDGTP